MRGRPKKPALIREMEGNPGKRRIPKEIAASGLPRPPEGLTEEEFELWTEIVAAIGLVDIGGQQRVGAVCLRLGEVAPVPAEHQRRRPAHREPGGQAYP